MLTSKLLSPRPVAFLSLLLAAWLFTPAIAPADDQPASAIQHVMQQQVEAWNRGDVETFMHGYLDSPETTFIGKTVQHGYAMILARYKKAYPDKETMGRLDFSGIEVRRLGAGYAVVTGNFHLARSAAAGGDAAGVFSLVWQKTPQGWKTILDHTSTAP